MFLTVCLPVGDWPIRVDLVGSFSLHVMETALCISQASAHWEGFPLPLTFRVSLEWVHNLLSTDFWLSWAYYVGNQAMLFPSLFPGCRELRMRRLCGSRQMCWGCGSKCRGSMSHLLYNLLFLLTCACMLDLVYTISIWPWNSALYFKFDSSAGHIALSLWWVVCVTKSLGVQPWPGVQSFPWLSRNLGAAFKIEHYYYY